MPWSGLHPQSNTLRRCTGGVLPLQGKQPSRGMGVPLDKLVHDRQMGVVGTIVTQARHSTEENDDAGGVAMEELQTNGPLLLQSPSG